MSRHVPAFRRPCGQRSMIDYRKILYRLVGWKRQILKTILSQNIEITMFMYQWVFTEKYAIFIGQLWPTNVCAAAEVHWFSYAFG